MHKHDILIVEDSKAQMEILASFLDQSGYQISRATNGKQALELFKAEPALVVLVDLEMPVMDGYTLIDELKMQTQRPVVIVLTANSDSDTIIRIMRKGVFDYIIKPVYKSNLLFKIESALKAARLTSIAELEELQKRNEDQINQHWSTYLQNLYKQPNARRSIFYNLHTNLNQGRGAGSLLTLMKFILEGSSKDGEEYVCRIHESLMETIHENVSVTSQLLEYIFDLSNLDLNPVKLQKATTNDLLELVRQCVRRLEADSSRDGSNITVNGLQADSKPVSFEWEVELMKKALLELLINALKFSGAKSQIDVQIRALPKEIAISVSNPVQLGDRSDYRSIPPELVDRLREPFVRLQKHMYEDYNTLDFGLGLPMVEQIVNKFGGLLKLASIEEPGPVSTDPVNVFQAQLLIPRDAL